MERVLPGITDAHFKFPAYQPGKEMLVEFRADLSDPALRAPLTNAVMQLTTLGKKTCKVFTPHSKNTCIKVQALHKKRLMCVLGFKQSLPAAIIRNIVNSALDDGSKYAQALVFHTDLNPMKCAWIFTGARDEDDAPPCENKVCVKIGTIQNAKKAYENCMAQSRNEALARNSAIPQKRVAHKEDDDEDLVIPVSKFRKKKSRASMLLEEDDD
jgi:hypothetical protein